MNRTATPTESTQQTRGSRTAIWALAGVAGFLIALIAAVVGARLLRERVIRPDNSAGPTTQADWIEQLDAGLDEAARQQAARKLVAMGPKAVIAALDATTDVPEGENRLQRSPAAIRAFASVGPEAVEALAEALASKRPDVRAAAANVLWEMGPDAARAVEPLAAVAGDQNRWVRWYAVETLGKIGPEAAPAVDALLPVVEHPEPRTRRLAVTALGRIGPAAIAAVPALTEAREKDKDRAVRGAAILALYQVNLEAIAAESAAAAGEEVRELIGRLSSDDEHESVSAANELTELGPQAADAVPALALALGRESKWLREAAAEALGAVGRQSQYVVPALEKLLEDKEPEVRAAAQKALDRIGGE